MMIKRFDSDDDEEINIKRLYSVSAPYSLCDLGLLKSSSMSLFFSSPSVKCTHLQRSRESQ
jgi:hypothetical protein